jgi:Rod binding domain-containing protein
MNLLAAQNLKTAMNASMLGTSRVPTAVPEQHDQLVKQTETWVSQTFFGTLLKQMRESPFKSELFSGGQGGQAFAGLQDQHLAEHMARGAGSKLVNSIVRQIEANAAYRKQATEKTGKTEKTEKTEKSDNQRPDEQKTRSTRKLNHNGASTLRT